MAKGYSMSNGKGSAGNVIAGIASFIIPGLGQLVQGRLFAAAFFFLLAAVIHALSLGVLGWVGHVIAAIEAAAYNPR